MAWSSPGDLDPFAFEAGAPSLGQACGKSLDSNLPAAAFGAANSGSQRLRPVVVDAAEAAPPDVPVSGAVERFKFLHPSIVRLDEEMDFLPALCNLS